jgi:hypothetical protein
MSDTTAAGTPAADPNGSSVTAGRSPVLSRRNVLRAGAVGLAALGAGAAKVLLAPSLGQRGLATPDGVFGAASMAFGDALYIEAFPTSPLILRPFTDPLVVPRALTPLTPAQVAALDPPPGPGPGQQNSFRNETHQLWVDALGLPDPIVYTIDLLVRRTRSPRPRSGRSTTTARTSSPSTPTATPSRPARSGPCRRARSTVSTGRSRAR